jgi:hypothetical protein
MIVEKLFRGWKQAMKGRLLHAPLIVVATTLVKKNARTFLNSRV